MWKIEIAVNITEVTRHTFQLLVFLTETPFQLILLGWCRTNSWKCVQKLDIWEVFCSDMHYSISFKWFKTSSMVHTFQGGITDWERKLANVTKCNVNKWAIWLIVIDKGSWTMETSSEALAWAYFPFTPIGFLLTINKTGLLNSPQCPIQFNSIYTDLLICLFSLPQINFIVVV